MGRRRDRRPCAGASVASTSTATPTAAATAGRWRGGTTAVVALLVEDDDGPRWLLANLGDSRIYRVAGGELLRVSIDHSVVQELVDAGQITEEEARVHPERHIVTRALGGPDAVDPDFFVLAARRGRAASCCAPTASPG